MELSPTAMQQIANASAQLGELSAMIENGIVKPYINKSLAYKIYGRHQVDKWLNAGLIKFIKDGDHSAAWRLDRLKLEIIEKAETLAKLF